MHNLSLHSGHTLQPNANQTLRPFPEDKKIGVELVQVKTAGLHVNVHSLFQVMKYCYFEDVLERHTIFEQHSRLIEKINGKN